MLFFVKLPSNTGIYTYCPPLSLHDACPICEKVIVRALRSRDRISGIAQIVAGLPPAELADHDIAVELVVQASGRLDSAVGCADLDRVPLGDTTRVGRFERQGKLRSGRTAAQGGDLSVLEIGRAHV